MAVPVIMPKQGQSVESCIIGKWYRKKGEQVREGELLFSYETDKASFDEEARVSGILLDVYFEEGDDVLCLTNVCVIGEAGEDTEAYNPNTKSTSEEGTVTAAAEAKLQNTGDSSGEAYAPAASAAEGRVKISPRARNYAEKAGVDYRYAAPSGPDGRIMEKDIMALEGTGYTMTPAAREKLMGLQPGQLPAGTGLGGRITTADLVPGGQQASDNAGLQPEGPSYEEVKLTNIRKTIAKAMFHSISTTCQLTFNTSFDATDILEFRKKLKEGGDRLGLGNITLNDMILFAVSRTLLRHKDLNAHFLGDSMRYFKNVNLGVAVDTERGLMVPTVFAADTKSLNDISGEVKGLIEECRSGSINPDKLKNGSFTVTNLGAMGVESFTPVLNPPQTGILGVNSIVQRAREKEVGYEFYPAMGLSLTFDHRALDGAPAARFLQELVNDLENFSVMLAK
ncbi:MAG TPA: dihydrolipoamide acetyltransferase family protein [Clostridia bacterium]|nr:dihydrolipoamide acetyltransferase family protein [Clostridia bacterium]